MATTEKQLKIEDSSKNEILIEYQKAQDSAEHYNTMVWTLISVGVGLSLFLIKFALFDAGDLENSALSPSQLQGLIYLLGAATMFYFGFLVRGANEKKIFKYRICEEIELNHSFFLGQNIGTRFLPITSKQIGITFFEWVEGTIIFLFLFLSFLVFIEKGNFGVTILFIGNVILFILFFVLKLSQKKPSFSEIINMVYEVRKKKFGKRTKF